MVFRSPSVCSSKIQLYYLTIFHVLYFKGTAHQLHLLVALLQRRFLKNSSNKDEALSWFLDLMGGIRTLISADSTIDNSDTVNFFYSSHSQSLFVLACRIQGERKICNYVGVISTHCYNTHSWVQHSGPKNLVIISSRKEKVNLITKKGLPIILFSGPIEEHQSIYLHSYGILSGGEFYSFHEQDLKYISNAFGLALCQASGFVFSCIENSVSSYLLVRR